MSKEVTPLRAAPEQTAIPLINYLNSNSSGPGTGGPPILPPQLLNILLNKENSERTDPVLLPEPSTHVRISKFLNFTNLLRFIYSDKAKKCSKNYPL